MMGVNILVNGSIRCGTGTYYSVKGEKKIV